MSTKFVTYLASFTEQEWLGAVENIAARTHEVDRNAVRIWFRFYPLALHRFLEAADDREKAAAKFVMQGNFELRTQIDSSHRFLYAHRFWKETKSAIEAYAASFGDGQPSIEKMVEDVAATVKADPKFVEAIAVIGLMTLNQAGLDAFTAAAGVTTTPEGLLAKSPAEIVAERKRDDSQGIFGFLKSVNKTYTVTWDEVSAEHKFRLTNDEDLATASAKDQSQNWKSRDERCWEGVVPVECRSAACGLCWVGVLGGEEKLSEVQRLERKQMKVFGYNQPEGDQPYLRLACQAKAHGNVSFVIPPWNGVFGKKIYGTEETELKPATTSAKRLRETIRTAVSGE